MAFRQTQRLVLALTELQSNVFDSGRGIDMHIPAQEASELLHALRHRVPAAPDTQGLSACLSFMRSKERLLRRGQRRWRLTLLQKAEVRRGLR